MNELMNFAGNACLCNDGMYKEDQRLRHYVEESRAGASCERRGTGDRRPHVPGT